MATLRVPAASSTAPDVRHRDAVDLHALDPDGRGGGVGRDLRRADGHDPLARREPERPVRGLAGRRLRAGADGAGRQAFVAAGEVEPADRARAMRHGEEVGLPSPDDAAGGAQPQVAPAVLLDGGDQVADRLAEAVRIVPTAPFIEDEPAPFGADPQVALGVRVDHQHVEVGHRPGRIQACHRPAADRDQSLVEAAVERAGGVLGKAGGRIGRRSDRSGQALEPAALEAHQPLPPRAEPERSGAILKDAPDVIDRILAQLAPVPDPEVLAGSDPEPPAGVDEQRLGIVDLHAAGRGREQLPIVADGRDSVAFEGGPDGVPGSGGDRAQIAGRRKGEVKAGSAEPNHPGAGGSQPIGALPVLHDAPAKADSLQRHLNERIGRRRLRPIEPARRDPEMTLGVGEEAADEFVGGQALLASEALDDSIPSAPDAAIGAKPKRAAGRLGHAVDLLVDRVRPRGWLKFSLRINGESAVAIGNPDPIV